MEGVGVDDRVEAVGAMFADVTGAEANDGRGEVLVPEGIWTGTLRLGVLVLCDPAFDTAADCAVGITVGVG
jgi:hypothetical protein